MSYTLSEFGDINIAACQLGKARKEFGAEGIFPALTQTKSLEVALKSMPLPPPGPVIQVGHWVASMKPAKYAAYFTLSRTPGKFVIFTELVENSASMVQMSSVLPKLPTTAMPIDIVPVLAPGPWESVPMNTWLAAERYVFRMVPSVAPAALVIHKALPAYIPGTLEHFVAGSRKPWSNDLWDLFTPKCKIEERRMTPASLSDRARAVILGQESAEHGTAIVENVEKSASGARDQFESCFSFDTILGSIFKICRT